MQHRVVAWLARSAAVAALLFTAFTASAVAEDAAPAPSTQLTPPVLAPGAAAPRLALADQHDQPAAIDENTRLIVFAADMEVSGFAKQALAEDGQELLAAASAVYVANISKMPGMISRMFALPAMRKRPYRMLLDRDGSATADWPTREGNLTLIFVTGDRVDRVEYVDSAEKLRRALIDAAVATSAPAPSHR